MGRHRRRRRGRWVRVAVTAVAGLAAVGVSVVVFVPGRSKAAPRQPQVLSDAVAKKVAALTGVPFSGEPAVGALFPTTASGGLADHFCTASVVDSPSRDLIITAAHCLAGSTPGIVFVPGYHDGQTPYGIWNATQTVVDSSWSASSDQDHDVAFVVVAAQSGSAKIQDVTGAETLATSGSPAGPVQVIGYPLGAGKPISCRNTVTAFGARQLEFDCRAFTNGTSGGPFLAGVDPSTGRGTVVGVIGGYQTGGNDPDVSYSISFGGDVRALYQTAVAKG
jgi:V8-like Glu-specific endopeptidase